MLVSSVLPVLLALRKLFHIGQANASEGACEELEQGNMSDRTPTPTSVEVRGRSRIWQASGGESMWDWMQKDLVICIKTHYGCKLLIPFISCSHVSVYLCSTSDGNTFTQFPIHRATFFHWWFCFPAKHVPVHRLLSLWTAKLKIYIINVI